MRLAWAALACSVIGLPLCLWLAAALMAQFSPDRVFDALTQANHEQMGRVIGLALAAGLLFSLLGAGLGAALLLWGRRHDAVPRHAGLALYLGSAGLLAACTAAAFCVVVNAVLIIEGPGSAIIAAGIIALALLEYALFRLTHGRKRGERDVAAS